MSGMLCGGDGVGLWQVAVHVEVVVLALEVASISLH